MKKHFEPSKGIEKNHAALIRHCHNWNRAFSALAQDVSKCYKTVAFLELDVWSHFYNLKCRCELPCKCIGVLAFFVGSHTTSCKPFFNSEFMLLNQYVHHLWMSWKQSFRIGHGQKFQADQGWWSYFHSLYRRSRKLVDKLKLLKFPCPKK